MIVDAYGRAIETRATNKTPTDWLREAFGGGAASTAGEDISPRVAMTVMTYFACVRNISEDIAKMPKRARQKKGREHKDLPAHPVSKLFRRPNPHTDAHTHWATFVAHALSEHGGFCEIVRDGAGQPVALYLLDPTRITVLRNDHTGAIVFRHRDLPANQAFAQSSILHLHGLGWDGISGYRMSDLARQVLGAAVAMQKYRGSFFGNGANPSGVLTHPATLGDAAAERLRRQFQQRYSGAANAWGAITLEEGMTWTPISVNPDDAQSVELEAVTIVDICRGFRMPPHKVQHLDNAHYANIEQDNINYATDTLDPWRDRLKCEIEFKLLTESELDDGVYIDINMKALMRGDVAARTAFYKQLFYMGAISANDILELEDENPVEFGDRRFMQANLIPTDKVDEVLAQRVSRGTAAPGTPATSGDGAPAQDAAARVRDAFQMLLENRIQHVLNIEIDRVRQAKKMDQFYAKFEKNIQEQILVNIRAVALVVDSVLNTQAIAANHAIEHCAASKRDIESGDVSSWGDGTRARLEAESLIAEIYKDHALCNTAA